MTDEETYFVVTEEPFCEHCMELEPYTLTWYDGSITWCIDCARNVDESFGTDEEVTKWEKCAKREKRAYFKSKVKELED